MTLQVDVAATQEINLNLQNSRVKSRLTEAMKRYNIHASITLGYNHDAHIRGGTYNPGGTMLMCHGLYTGRLKKRVLINSEDGATT